MPDLRRISVFVASPGDVALAREHIRHATERINRLVAKEAGFLLEAVGWEDIPPDQASRSQEVINPYVDSAHIFIGILHQRFGQPTGIADSGTAEEFLRIDKRWQEEDPKPTIMLYFKKVPADRLADPGPQLKKVLDFKQRIEPSAWYREFEDEAWLEKEVENALADWVYKHRGKTVHPVPEEMPHPVKDQDADILAALAKNSPASPSDIANVLGRSEDDARTSLERLVRQKLSEQTPDTGTYRLPTSADAFTAIAKRLLSQPHYQSFLTSSYFAAMLEKRLPGILANRQHCTMKEEDLATLQVHLKTSPSAAEFVLFGDTTVFDNLADQVQQPNISETLKEMAQESTAQTVLHQALRFWVNDAMDGKILHELDGRLIAGQVVRLQVSAAFEDRLAFQRLAVVPLMLFKASGRIEAGQMVSGPPVSFVRQGTILSHMGEDELALHAFDRALSAQIPADARAIALSHKGSALSRLGRTAEAILCFEEALQFNSNLKEAKENLQRLKAPSQTKAEEP